MGKKAKEVLQAEKLEAVADRGYFNSPKILACQMALHVLAYNLTSVMNIIGIKPLMAAIRA